MLGFTSLTSLKLDQAVFFPGNERHGIWASPLLETVYPPPPGRAAKPAAPTQKPAAPRPKSVAERSESYPRN